MPLSIRDGNSSLTTLSTLVVNSAHVPAHTVVSLGSQAITDIAQAVSGVELGPNTINALENISVTFGTGASITVGNIVSVTGGLTNAELRASPVTIGGSVSATISGTPSVTFSQASVTFGAVTGSVSVLNFPTTQTVAGVVTANVPIDSFVGGYGFASDNNGVVPSFGVQLGFENTDGDFLTASQYNPLPISGTVTANLSNVQIDADGNLLVCLQSGTNPNTQSISGTVTANAGDFASDYGQDQAPPNRSIAIGWGSDSFSLFQTTGEDAPLPVQIINGTLTPAIVPISGTVTANVYLAGYDQTYEEKTELPVISFSQPINTAASDKTIPVQIANDFGTLNSTNPLPISGTVTANVASSSNIGIGFRDISGNLINVDNLGSNLPVNIFTSAGDSAVGFEGGDGVAGAVGIGHNSNGQFNIVGENSPLPISGTVTVGNSVTIGSLPAISGTVTANGGDFVGEEAGSKPQKSVNIGYYDENNWEFRGVTNVNNPLPISGTVTANVPFKKDYTVSPWESDVLPVQIISPNNGEVLGWSGFPLSVAGAVTVGNSVTVSALPSGALTTRFGSVATANLAFITSAVTNTSRKYLLAQNISTGTVTIGIGFSPTTTQGIQLTAGGGLTFDAFCPTGAVYWLGAVTGAAFTILEG